MKHTAQAAAKQAPEPTQGAPLNRRHLFIGAGAAGALAAVAVATQRTVTAAAATAAPESVAAATGGYQLTDHVKQYYASARV